MARETDEEKKAREMVEEIATNIAHLSREVKSLLSGRLKKDTIIILLAHSTGLPQRTIMAVLKALEDMEKVHLK